MAAHMALVVIADGWDSESHGEIIARRNISSNEFTISQDPPQVLKKL